MGYLCYLGTNQSICVDQQATQTIVMVASTSPGQQQQQSSSFQTGRWVTPPQAFQTDVGVVIQLQTAEGQHTIQVQGGSLSLGAMEISPSAQSLPLQEVEHPPFQPMQPMAPMSPMQPMRPLPPMPPMSGMPPMQPLKMGNMQMSLNPMEMKMGNMELRMGTPNPPATERQFCTQCGTPVQPTDRFCAHCGFNLSR